MVDASGQFPAGRPDQSWVGAMYDELRWTCVPSPGAEPTDHAVPSGFQNLLPPLGIIVQAEGEEPRMVAGLGIPEPHNIGGIEQIAESVIRSGTPHTVGDSGFAYFPVGQCNGQVVLIVLQDRSRSLPVTTAQPTPNIAAPFGGRLGLSPRMLEFARRLEKHAASESKIMLFGETGTGKTMIAKLIHEASPRREKGFQVVDCSTLTPEQFESKIFGHERGAFTGAERLRVGALEAARGGTLFIDEVGELSLDMQLRLLNVIETKTFHRMGANADAPPKECDVRFIVATHRKLKEMVDLGEFRADLYYRLGGEEFTVPPLRERGDDLLRLAEQLLSDLPRATGSPPKHLTPAARNAIASYGWPGNARELITVLECACRSADGPAIDVQHVGREGGTQSFVGVSPILPPPPHHDVRTQFAPQTETDAPTQKHIETFLISFLKRWRTCGRESEDVLLSVLGQIGGGKPAKWLRHFRRGLLANVGDALEQNKLGDLERLTLRNAILKEAAEETGRDAWAAAAARLLGAGAKAAPLVKKAKKEAGISS